VYSTVHSSEEKSRVRERRLSFMGLKGYGS